MGKLTYDYINQQIKDPDNMPLIILEGIPPMNTERAEALKYIAEKYPIVLRAPSTAQRTRGAERTEQTIALFGIRNSDYESPEGTANWYQMTKDLGPYASVQTCTFSDTESDRTGKFVFSDLERIVKRHKKEIAENS